MSLARSRMLTDVRGAPLILMEMCPAALDVGLARILSGSKVC